MQVETGAVAREPGSSNKNRTGSWRTFRPRVSSRCTGCGICGWYCPEGVIKIMERDGKKTIEIDYDYCKGCGICAAECPLKAISMEREEK